MFMRSVEELKTVEDSARFAHVLGGRGRPRRTSAFRRFHLRLWRPEPGAWSGDNLATILSLIGDGRTLRGLRVAWNRASARGRECLSDDRHSLLPPADGPLVAGVVEEAAFRGSMQSHLERIGPTFAIVVTSAAFTLIHGTHGLAYLLTVAPGFFLASLVYGYLALKSGSILPGMIIIVTPNAGESWYVNSAVDPRARYEDFIGKRLASPDPRSDSNAIPLRFWPLFSRTPCQCSIWRAAIRTSS